MFHFAGYEELTSLAREMATESLLDVRVGGSNAQRFAVAGDERTGTEAAERSEGKPRYPRNHLQAQCAGMQTGK